MGNINLSLVGEITTEGSEKFSTEYIKVHHFYDSTMSLSDIQLATNILQDSPNQNSMFYKNSVEVIPAPTSSFWDQ